MKKKTTKAATKRGVVLQSVVKCAHYWSNPHSVWQGRRDSEVAVARYCSRCGKKQIAFASKWQNIPASFPDVRDACHD